MKPFFVYILKCNDNSYYIGQTDDLEKRISEYKSGDNPAIGKYVLDRLPVELVFYEQFETRIEAIQAERKLKGWSRIKKDTLIKGGWQAVKGIWRK